MAKSRKQVVLQLTEYHDPGALNYVVSNWDDFTHPPDFSPQDLRKQLIQTQKYQASSSSDGSRVVSYSYAAGRCDGRLFADGGLSLQGIPRHIPNAIAHRLYEDVDMVKCHPNLLLQYCQKNGINAPRLQQYCEQRDTVLGEMLADAPGRKDDAKKAILKTINGGNGLADTSKFTVTPWFVAFCKEAAGVRGQVLLTEQGAHYMAEAREKHADNPEYNNVSGSAINLLLCHLENECLTACTRYMEEYAGVCVTVPVARLAGAARPPDVALPAACALLSDLFS